MRCVGIVFLVMLGCFFGSQPVNAQSNGGEPDVLGFSKEPPADKRLQHVPVSGGYLVPYTALIPGTEVRFEMVPVPGGVVSLGSLADERGRREDEGPQVQVTIEPMWVGKCEVTQGEFNQYMRMHRLFKDFDRRGIRKVTPQNAARAVTAPTELYDVTDRIEVGIAPDMPAVGMTPFAAKQYTKWLSGMTGEQYRLPTEAEWEYACCARTNTAFSFGNKLEALDQHAWCKQNSEGELHRVGAKLPNAFGLHDMHGSVREWTVDGFTSNGYRSLAEKPQPISFIDAIQWPTRADERVARGGSWDDGPSELRSAARFSSDDKAMKDADPELPQSVWWYTTEPSLTIGFRIVRSYRPLDEAVIRKFYEADHPEIVDALQYMLDFQRAVRGLADPSLADEMKKETAR